MQRLPHIYKVVLLLLPACLLTVRATSIQGGLFGRVYGSIAYRSGSRNSWRNNACCSLEGQSYFFYQQPAYPRDCKEVLDQCSSENVSGVYTIRPDGYLLAFEAFCDNIVTSGGWTVIQRQFDGSLTFKRKWEDYKNGFGFLSSEFWIGLEKLSYLTNQAVYELRIDMVLANGSLFYIKYDSFRISDEWSQYALVTVEGFSGNSSCVVSTCPSNSVHGGCTCQSTCSHPISMIECEDNCVETCVPNGCFNSDTEEIIPNGETYVNSDCSQKCTCNNNRLSCNSNYECSPNAECRVEDGVRQCYCNEGYEGDGEICNSTTFSDCYDAYQAGQRQDKVYSILPSGWSGSAFDVLCNMTIDGGGWTVLQRRVDGSENFERNWNEYKTGFGLPGPEMWLGNDKIHYITRQKDYELRMDMVNLDADPYFAKYSLFRIKNEDNKYQLELGNYDSSSTTGYDAMNYHRNRFFSTPDSDNDGYSYYNCASERRSAWWYYYYYYYYNCKHCDFNSPNFGSSTVPSPYWYNLPGIDEFMYSDIKIRPV